MESLETNLASFTELELRGHIHGHHRDLGHALDTEKVLVRSSFQLSAAVPPPIAGGTASRAPRVDEAFSTRLLAAKADPHERLPGSLRPM